MKLITFQTKEAWAILQKKGILTANPSYINLQKYSVPYDWIVKAMKEQKILPKNKEKYPLWAWAKCGRFMAPAKRKNIHHVIQDIVKITFEKTPDEVLLSDYMAYSFLLSGFIVPKTHQEYNDFFDELKRKNISLADLKNFVRNQKVPSSVCKLFPEIQKTWPRIFDLKSNVHQACVWNIKLSEVKKVEIPTDSNYVYGVMNYLKADGTGINWKEKYLQFLSE